MDDRRYAILWAAVFVSGMLNLCIGYHGGVIDGLDEAVNQSLRNGSFAAYGRHWRAIEITDNNAQGAR